ncbi:MAG: MBL fold metallo-hydrolase [Christensenella sp.]|uniref:MBL fold metallo-hydrolase n=1 Tax=Christensenella sp. TaxID=1935934 RepID=UPI002B21D1C9|nr:MBL fold metallo-hydrolase [Christensenella sp.]MEA5004159.1 MBL fold metallo-hydrolase [Christensenella sp.]
MYEVVNVGAQPGGEAFLLVTPERTALVDAGFAHSAGRMIENIKKALGDRPLDYVLLTHSHYDHASGSIYCKREWRDVQVVGSVHAAAVFQKDSARRLIREMNENAAMLAGVAEYEDITDGLTVDTVVGEGDVIDLGSLKLRVIETPGHTRCCISFFSEEEKLLIACETLGVPAGDGVVMPCYMTGYQATMDSVMKMAAVKPRAILVPHYGLWQGEKCYEFIGDAIFWNAETMRLMWSEYAAGKTEEELKGLFRERFYTEQMARLQPEKAFLLNADYTIPLLLKEIERKMKK